LLGTIADDEPSQDSRKERNHEPLEKKKRSAYKERKPETPHPSHCQKTGRTNRGKKSTSVERRKKRTGPATIMILRNDTKRKHALAEEKRTPKNENKENPEKLGSECPTERFTRGGRTTDRKKKTLIDQGEGKILRQQGKVPSLKERRKTRMN